MAPHIIDGIERTPEYYAFVQNLEQFHSRRGTHLLKEPIHGGQSLDLLRIYKFVLEAGGYAEVTRQRLWKQISVPFGFPDTTTNSAYVFKQTYIASLLAFEFEDYWKRPAPPPRDIEDQVTRRRRPPTQGGHQHDTPGPESPFTGDMRDGSPNPPAGTFDSPPPQANVLTPARPKSPPLPSYPFSGPLTSVAPEALYVEPGHHNRLLLALKSEIPSEVDWSLQRLVKTSYEYQGALRFVNIPGLIESLLTHITPVLSLEKYREQEAAESFETDGRLVRDELFGAKSQFETRERMLAAALVLRNCSMVEDNARFLANHGPARKMAIQGVQITSRDFSELRLYCLDIVDGMSPYLRLDKLLHALWHALFDLVSTSNDRYLMVGALRSMTRLAAQEKHHGLLEGGVSHRLIKILGHLLLVDDGDLVAGALDYFYQYTVHRTNAAVMVETSPNLARSLIATLMHLVGWQAKIEEMSVPGAAKVHSSGEFDQPEIPQESIERFLHLPEPKRAIDWMRFVFETDPNENITQVQCWMMYKAQWEPYVAKGIPMLPAAEVIKSISSAFPEALAMVTHDEPKRFIIKGIKLRSFADPNKKYKCEWMTKAAASKEAIVEADGDTIVVEAQECTNAFPDVSSLYRHIETTHVVDGDLRCRWLSCQRFKQSPAKSRSAALLHIRTHLPEEGNNKPAHDSKGQPHFVQARKIHTVTDEEGNPVGIPLTAALVLRNIARGEAYVRQKARIAAQEESNQDDGTPPVLKQEPSLLFGYMQTLIDLMAHNPSLSKYILDSLDAIRLDEENQTTTHGASIQTMGTL